MIEKILACPFPHCKGERCEMYHENQLWYVFCDTCGTEGPFADTEAEAVTLWNAAANALAAKDAEIARLEEQYEKEYTKLFAAMRKIDVLERHLIETTDRAMIAEVQQDELKIKYAECNAAWEKHDDYIANIPMNFKDVLCERDKLEAKIAELKALLEQALEQRQQFNANWQTELRRRSAGDKRQDELEAEIEKLRNEYELFRQQYTCFKNDTLSLTRKRHNEIEELKKELDRWRDMVIPLSNERDELRNQRNSVTNDLNKERCKVHKLQQEIAEHRRHVATVMQREAKAIAERDEARRVANVWYGVAEWWKKKFIMPKSNEPPTSVDKERE